MDKPRSHFQKLPIPLLADDARDDSNSERGSQGPLLAWTGAEPVQVDPIPDGGGAIGAMCDSQSKRELSIFAGNEKECVSQPSEHAFDKDGQPTQEGLGTFMEVETVDRVDDRDVTDCGGHAPNRSRDRAICIHEEEPVLLHEAGKAEESTDVSEWVKAAPKRDGVNGEASLGEKLRMLATSARDVNVESGGA